MGIFEDEINNIAGESIFTHVELEKLFRTDVERDTFMKVRTALAESTNINETTKKLVESGADAIKVLVKVAKYALTA